MEKFVLAGKAKTVFQIIELMAKGEELDRKQKATERKVESIEGSLYRLWRLRNN